MNLVTEDEFEVTQFPAEFLNSLKVSGLPLFNLKLKCEAIVILLRNINVNCGLLNGTKLIVRSMNENCLNLEIVKGQITSHWVLLPRIDLTTSDTNLHFHFRNLSFC